MENRGATDQIVDLTFMSRYFFKGDLNLAFLGDIDLIKKIGELGNSALAPPARGIRSITVTLAPSSCRRSAMALPMPPFPPV
jgi:hypothetical protein